MATTASYHYAVIGGGIAGVTCAEHLHILDGERSTVLISSSDVIKCVTNVLHLTKTIEMFDVEERNAQSLTRQCPSVTVNGGSVCHLDAVNKRIELDNGSVIQYEKLCVCTGGVPKQLFLGYQNVLHIRDTESVHILQEKIKDAKRVLIVGNGGIATEMVYEISGVEVVWAIKQSYINAAFIDPGAAEFLRPELAKDKQNTERAVSKRAKFAVNKLEATSDSSMGGALGPDWLSGLGLSKSGDAGRRSVRLETEVEVIKLWTAEEWKREEGNEVTLDEDWSLYAKLSNGKVIGCDFLVSATGVEPNTKLLKESGGFCFGPCGGVNVDDSLQTGVEGVYAAGDVVCAAWGHARHWHQMRLWTQARQMGSYAAKCMWAAAIGQEVYQDFCFELFTHATKFFGKKVILLGLYNGQKLDGQYELLLRMTRGEEYIKVVMKDGRMQGALLIGETDLEETFENLILNQLDLSDYGEDLLDPDIDIEDYFD